MCNGTKNCFKSESLALVSVRTIWPPSSTLLVLVVQICVVVLRNELSEQVYTVHIYNPTATWSWQNCNYMLPLNGRSRAHKLFRWALKIYWKFSLMSSKMAGPHALPYVPRPLRSVTKTNKQTKTQLFFIFRRRASTDAHQTLHAHRRRPSYFCRP